MRGEPTHGHRTCRGQPNRLERYTATPPHLHDERSTVEAMSVVGGRIRARGTYASGVTDFVGLALIGLFVAWTLVTAANRGVSTRPDPVWQLAIAAAAAYAVGRAAGAVAPVLAPAALAAGVAAWFVLTPGAFSGMAAPDRSAMATPTLRCWCRPSQEQGWRWWQRETSGCDRCYSGARPF